MKLTYRSIDWDERVGITSFVTSLRNKVIFSMFKKFGEFLHKFEIYIKGIKYEITTQGLFEVRSRLLTGLMS